MTPIAIVTMILICGLVWGGFLSLLIRAVGREGSKRAAEEARGGQDDGSPAGDRRPG